MKAYFYCNRCNQIEETSISVDQISHRHMTKDGKHGWSNWLQKITVQQAFEMQYTEDVAKPNIPDGM